jgi:hypothetical protein
LYVWLLGESIEQSSSADEETIVDKVLVEPYFFNVFCRAAAELSASTRCLILLSVTSRVFS